MKPGSPGNSPHYVQRRRTTAAHTARDHSRISQDNPQLTREQRLWNYYNHRKDVLEARPFSWHPGSANPQPSHDPMPVNDNTMGNAIAGIENLAVTSTPPSSVQQSIQDAFSMGYGYPINTASVAFTPPVSDSQAFYAPTASTNQNPAFSFPAYDYPEPTFDPYGQSYQTNDYSTPQWIQPTDSSVTFVDNRHSTAASATSLQRDANPLQYLHTKELPETPKIDGEELVGIGLYDNADQDYVSTLSSTTRDDPRKSTTGKELKLQETWHPPSNEEDDEESSDENEEVEELPIDTSATSEVQPALYHNYGDLSNQSFFISDDVEIYPDGDQYSNYIALNNGLQAMEQMKTQPAGPGNLLWF